MIIVIMTKNKMDTKKINEKFVYILFVVLFAKNAPNYTIVTYIILYEL